MGLKNPWATGPSRVHDRHPGHTPTGPGSPVPGRLIWQLLNLYLTLLTYVILLMFYAMSNMIFELGFEYENDYVNCKDGK